MRPRQVETTVLGAAYLAGLAVGMWTDREDVRESWVVDRQFEPTWSEDERESRYEGWRLAVKRALSL
jgi:glycerol kinase